MNAAQAFAQRLAEALGPRILTFTAGPLPPEQQRRMRRALNDASAALARGDMDTVAACRREIDEILDRAEAAAAKDSKP